MVPDLAALVAQSALVAQAQEAANLHGQAMQPHYPLDHLHNGGEADDAAGDGEDDEDEGQGSGQGHGQHGNKRKQPGGDKKGAKGAASSVPKDAGCRNQTGYIGVRQRKWGMFAAEIRDGDKRRWLGSFSTGREAGMAYDAAAISQKGSKAKTNFKYLDFASIPRLEAETEEKVMWSLLPKDIAEKFPIPTNPYGTGARDDAEAAAEVPSRGPRQGSRRTAEHHHHHQQLSLQQQSPEQRQPSDPEDSQEPPYEPHPQPQPKRSRLNRGQEPTAGPRGASRYPSPYPLMADGYAVDEDAMAAAHMAAAAAGGFYPGHMYPYPGMYPHMDAEAFEQEAVHRHYGMMAGMHPSMYGDAGFGMGMGGMMPVPAHGGAAPGPGRPSAKRRDAAAAVAAASAAAAAAGTPCASGPAAAGAAAQPRAGQEEAAEPKPGSGSGAKSSRGAAASRGAHPSKVAHMFEYGLNPYYSMPGLPYPNGPYMLGAPVFGGRYPGGGSDGGARRGSPARSGGAGGSAGAPAGAGASGGSRQNSEAPAAAPAPSVARPSRLRSTEDSQPLPAGQPDARQPADDSQPGSPEPGDPDPQLDAAAMMHHPYEGMYHHPGYEHMMHHPYMHPHPLYGAPYGHHPHAAAMAGPSGSFPVAEPLPSSLYTSTPGPTTGGTLVRPRAVHAKPEYGVPHPDAMMGYHMPGAFQPYHPGMAVPYHRYHLDQAMYQSHFQAAAAMVGHRHPHHRHGRGGGGEEELGEGEAGEDEEGGGEDPEMSEQLHSKWRAMAMTGRLRAGGGGSDGGAAPPGGVAQADLMRVLQSVDGTPPTSGGGAPPRGAASVLPKEGADAIVAAAAVVALQHQEQEQQQEKLSRRAP